MKKSLTKYLYLIVTLAVLVLSLFLTRVNLESAITVTDKYSVGEGAPITLFSITYGIIGLVAIFTIIYGILEKQKNPVILGIGMFVYILMNLFGKILPAPTNRILQILTIVIASVVFYLSYIIILLNDKVSIISPILWISTALFTVITAFFQALGIDTGVFIMFLALNVFVLSLSVINIVKGKNLLFSILAGIHIVLWTVSDINSIFITNAAMNIVAISIQPALLCFVCMAICKLFGGKDEKKVDNTPLNDTPAEK